MAVAPASTAGGRRLEPGRHCRGPFGGSTSHATLSSERVPAKDRNPPNWAAPCGAGERLERGMKTSCRRPT